MGYYSLFPLFSLFFLLLSKLMNDLASHSGTPILTFNLLVYS